MLIKAAIISYPNFTWYEETMYEMNVIFSMYLCETRNSGIDDLYF
jgi:hypothetical protein